MGGLTQPLDFRRKINERSLNASKYMSYNSIQSDSAGLTIETVVVVRGVSGDIACSSHVHQAMLPPWP